MTYNRYAIYFVPAPAEDWAQFCTQWLGWDIETGCAVPHPELAGLQNPVSALTAVPRRYGFHATIKPPFRLAAGRSERALLTAMEDTAGKEAPVVLDGLRVSRLGRFLALTAQGQSAPLDKMAAQVVRGLDGFRAPASDQELARRRSGGLTPEQDRNLTRWGYPYVMQDFRFHMTLTGKLPRDDLSQVETVLDRALAPLLPRPAVLTDLALVGEDSDGYFHMIQRFALRGG